MDFRGPFVRPSGIVQPAPEVRSEAILDDTRLRFFYYNRFFNQIGPSGTPDLELGPGRGKSIRGWQA